MTTEILIDIRDEIRGLRGEVVGLRGEVVGLQERMERVEVGLERVEVRVEHGDQRLARVELAVESQGAAVAMLSASVTASMTQRSRVERDIAALTRRVEVLEQDRDAS